MQFFVLAAVNLLVFISAYYELIDSTCAVFAIGVINFFVIIQIINKKSIKPSDTSYYSLDEISLGLLIEEARKNTDTTLKLLLANINCPIDDSKGFLDCGQFRRAITTSLIIVYIAMIALQTSTKFKSIGTEEMKSFTNLVIFVILFYFGSRAVQDYKTLTQ